MDHLIKVTSVNPTPKNMAFAARFEAYLNGNPKFVAEAKKFCRREIRKHVHECMTGIVRMWI